MWQTTLLLSLVFSATAFAADSQLMNLVMPDAKILAGVNATTALASPFGQFLLSKIALSGHVPQGLTAATGFNPFQDVSEILAATAADPSNPGGLVMARGTFPVDKIAALLTATGASAKWQLSTYGGATLLSTTNSNANPKAKIAHAVAFIGNSIAVGGDLVSVKAAIDRSTGANSIDPALAVTVNQLSGTEDEWLASSASIASLLPANIALGTNGPAATLLPLLKNIQAFNGGVKFGENVALSGEMVTSSAQNAAALNAVIKLGIILAGSSSANTAGNPQFAEAIQFLQALQVSPNGSAVDLSLSIPEAQIESLVNSTPTSAKKAVASVRHPELHNGN